MNILHDRQHPVPATFNKTSRLGPAFDSTWSLATTTSTSGTSLTLTSLTSSGSERTISGLGALSGKAVLALGKGTLRVAEYFIIRRRLNVISSKFPHTNDVRLKGIDQMYDDILELSRLGLYPEFIREKAILLLVVQIGCRQTALLVKRLIRWPSVEINIFLSVMASVLNPFRLSLGGEQSDIVSAYRDSIANWEGHSFEPFIDFLGQVMRSTKPPSLESGIMDFLLQVYATNFRDPLATLEPTEFHRQSALHAACNHFLSIASGTQKGQDLIRGHPLHVIWSRHPRMTFTHSVQNRERRRIEIWQLATKEHILWRIHSIFSMMLDWTRSFDDLLLVDVAFDLLEISGSSTIEPEVSTRALRSFHMFLTRGNVQAQRAILSYLDLCDRAHCTSVMKQIIVRLSTLIIQGTSEARMFFLQWDDDDFKHTAALHFIHCLFNIAKREPHFLSVMLDANMLGLLRPFLENEGVPGIAHHPRESSMIYEPAELELIDLIRDHGLERYLPPPAEEPPDYIVYRRSVLVRAFDIFLLREDQHPFPEILNAPWDDLPNGLEGSDYISFWTSQGPIRCES